LEAEVAGSIHRRGGIHGAADGKAAAHCVLTGCDWMHVVCVMWSDAE